MSLNKIKRKLFLCSSFSHNSKMRLKRLRAMVLEKKIMRDMSCRKTKKKRKIEEENLSEKIQKDKEVFLHERKGFPLSFLVLWRDFLYFLVISTNVVLLSAVYLTNYLPTILMET